MTWKKGESGRSKREVVVREVNHPLPMCVRYVVSHITELSDSSVSRLWHEARTEMGRREDARKLAPSTP